MSTVKQSTIYNIGYWRECYLKAKSASIILAKLPLRVRASEGNFDHSYGNVYTLNLEGEASFELAFDCGVVFKENYTFTGRTGMLKDMELSTDFMATGELSDKAKRHYGIDEDITVKVKVTKLPKPPTCVIEVVTEEVTKYVARCIETEEQL